MEALPKRIIKVRFVCDSEWARAAAAERAHPGSTPPASPSSLTLSHPRMRSSFPLHSPQETQRLMSDPGARSERG